MKGNFDKIYYDTVRKAQSTGKPVARYMKSIVGKIGIGMVDPLTGEPMDIVLEGDPSEADEEDITVTIWTEFGHEYFRRTNRKLLEKGYLIKYEEDIKSRPPSPNEVSDKELREALGEPFFSTKAFLDKFTEPAPAIRMLQLAKEMNKSSGTVEAIKKRVSELQGKNEVEK